MIANRLTEPVIAPDQAWEQDSMPMVIAVIPDVQTNQLQMFYLVRFPDAPLNNILCLALSEDGCTWSKPDLGDGTNIVMRSTGNDVGWGEFMPTAIIRDDQEKDPARAFKMVYWERPDPALPPGICWATSPDGRTWTPLLNRPVITNSNDAMSMIDGIAGQQSCFGTSPYYIYQQTFAHAPDLPTERDNLKDMRRQISLWTCRSFDDGWWVGPINILSPDADDPHDLQFYWMVPFKTPEGGYRGLLNCHHTGDQTMDVQLISSPDGWTWSRENQRTPILGLGGAGRFDCGMVIAVARPIIWQGKTMLYYNGRATVHDGQPHYPDEPLPDPVHGIGLAELPTDVMTG